ncbi:MAG: hypothetical protein J6S85_02615 [Methanobrevibacter sp.]|nr:hypothetical protein [Methanobrevibacter sp.]
MVELNNKQLYVLKRTDAGFMFTTFKNYKRGRVVNSFEIVNYKARDGFNNYIDVIKLILSIHPAFDITSIFYIDDDNNIKGFFEVKGGEIVIDN